LLKIKDLIKLLLKKEQIYIDYKPCKPFDETNPFGNVILIDVLRVKFVYNNEVFKFHFIPKHEDFHNFRNNSGYTNFRFDVVFKCFNVKNTFQLKYYYDVSYLKSNPLEQVKISNKWFIFFEKNNRELFFHKDNFIKLLDIFIRTNFTLERDKLLHSIIKLTFPNNKTSADYSYTKILEYLRSKCDDIKSM